MSAARMSPAGSKSGDHGSGESVQIVPCRVLDGQRKKEDERENHCERGHPEPDGPVAPERDEAQSLCRSSIDLISTRAATERVPSVPCHHIAVFGGDRADVPDGGYEIPMNGRLEQLNGSEETVSGPGESSSCILLDPETFFFHEQFVHRVTK
jgi:hypothetical protein